MRTFKDLDETIKGYSKKITSDYLTDRHQTSIETLNKIIPENLQFSGISTLETTIQKGRELHKNIKLSPIAQANTILGSLKSLKQTYSLPSNKKSYINKYEIKERILDACRLLKIGEPKWLYEKTRDFNLWSRCKLKIYIMQGTEVSK